MIVTGHQPNYLPYPGFFEKIARADLYVVVENVQFVKRGPFGWIHRNRIKSGREWDWLTIPVLTKGKFTQTIRETRINNAEPWARKHWRTLEWNYKKAPHFARYADPLRAVYEKKWDWLWELNTEFIRVLLDLLEIRTPVKISGDLGVEGHATDLVLDLCRKTGATTYLSGKHGRDYLETGKFDAAGIGLRFQEYTVPTYSQTPPEPFVSGLSVIDLLFNCGPDSRRLIIEEGRGEETGGPADR